MAEPFRLLCLGDSYTVGEGVGPSGSWPHQLVAALVESGLPVSAPDVIARTGWTTDELLDGLAAAAPRGPYALVTLMIGVNDQYRGRPITEFRRGFRRLLRAAIRLAGSDRSRVLVISIPDWGVTTFARGRDSWAIATDIDRRNALATALATRRAVSTVDVTEISRRLADSPEALAADGLHPSKHQYARWVEALLAIVRAKLER